MKTYTGLELGEAERLQATEGGQLVIEADLTVILVVKTSEELAAELPQEVGA